MKGGKKEKKRSVKNGLSVGEYIRHACDNVIDIFDVVIVAKNFSRITPILTIRNLYLIQNNPLSFIDART